MITSGHYAVSSHGRIVARYSSNRLARMRAAFYPDVQILWVTGRLTRKERA